MINVYLKTNINKIHKFCEVNEFWLDCWPTFSECILKMIKQIDACTESFL